MTHLKATDNAIPPIWKQSKAKIWLRTVILAVFSVIFGAILYQDISQGIFEVTWALMAFIPSLGVGFWMSRLVPMQVHSEMKVITISFDRIYFTVIFLLVALKVIADILFTLNIVSDVIICIILGLMVSRLSGICVRVRSLKNLN